MNDSTAVVLDFEKDILEIEEKIEHLKFLAKDEDMDITREIKRLERKLGQHINRTYMNLSAWRMNWKRPSKSRTPSAKT